MNENFVLEKGNEIIQFLRREEPKKKDFFPLLQELDDFFVKEFRDIKEPADRVFFRYNEDERLQDIERKIVLLEKNPECCLLEGVKFCEDKMRRFLKKYHIGFVKDFYAKENGTFFVNLACLITSTDSFHEETATKELKEQFQLDLLRSKGIKVERNEKLNHNEIIATTESMDALDKLLTEELNAQILKIQLREFGGVRSVDKIEMYVKPEIFFDKDWSPYEIILESKEDTLNPNEVGHLYHELKEMFSSYQNISFMEETCVSLVKSHFTDICRVVGFEGKIFHEKEDKSKPIREKNQLIREKEVKLGSMMKSSFKESAERVSKRINKEIYELLNFNVLNIELTPHQLLIKCSFATGPNWNGYKQMTDEELKILYDTNDGTIDDENMLIECSERNQRTLKEKMNSLYSEVVLTELNVQNHWSNKMNSIKGFTASLDNLTALV